MSSLCLYGYSFHPCPHQQPIIIGCSLFPIQGSSCSVGVYVDCGSVYKAPETTGASQLLKTMAFATTANRSELRVVREIEAIGGSAKASAGREMMSYTYGA